jgi:hypothetical protein
MPEAGALPIPKKIRNCRIQRNDESAGVECVFHVLYTHFPTAQENPDHVEAVFLTWTPVPVDPDVCRPAQFALFSPVDGFDGITEKCPGPGFYFDESHHLPALDDDVYVTAPVPKPQLPDNPTLIREPLRRDPLAKLAEIPIA